MKQKQIKCPKCKARYWLKNAFETHLKKRHPFSKHISYVDAIKGLSFLEELRKERAINN